MELLIQIERTARNDDTAILGAVAAYLATFAAVEAATPARHYVRRDRAGDVSLSLHEYRLALPLEGAAEVAKAIAKFMKDVLRRSGQDATVSVLIGAGPTGSP
jgi:hypothetical protein